MQKSRRDVIQILAAAGAVGFVGIPATKAMGKVAGFSPEPWFASSTGDLSKDLAAAAGAGKYLALLWEQKGCHYCGELHAVNFKTPEIIDLGKKHFHTLQMDLWGARKFKDFDGEEKSEAAIAKSKFVRATPVILFYDSKGTEVFRMPGYAPPPLQHAVYVFVAEGAYKAKSFSAWMEEKQPGG